MKNSRDTFTTDVTNVQKEAMVSVIVPVRNAAQDLAECLTSILATEDCPFEIIVVDDASTDDSAEVAKEKGARVVCLDQRSGPAIARNRGAAEAQGEFLLFIDADVLVCPDTLCRFAGTLQKTGCAAAFGSYDVRPSATNFVSQYKNLLHHHVHQEADRQASTFWSGCGAVRHSVFLEMSGFSELFQRPCIEDIELGMRLIRSGHQVILDSDIQVTHTKRWTPWSLLKTDVFDRAIPWTRLILQEGRVANDLNLKRTQRVCVALALLTLILLGMVAWQQPAILLLPVSVFTLLLSVEWFSRWKPRRPNARHLAIVILLAVLSCFAISVPVETSLLLLPVTVVLCLNHLVYRFFARHRGRSFAIMVVPLHMLYFLYSGLSFGIGVVGHMFQLPWGTGVPRPNLHTDGPETDYGTRYTQKRVT